jgi:hypothetical protein
MDDLWPLVEHARQRTSHVDAPDVERHAWAVARIGVQLAREDACVDAFAVIAFALFTSRPVCEQDDPAIARHAADALRAYFAGREIPRYAMTAAAACELRGARHRAADDPTVAACLEADHIASEWAGAPTEGTVVMPEPDEPMVWSQLWLVAARWGH